MLSNVARPSSTASTMCAKLSSSSTRSAASRATSVPDDPHRHADVRLAERRSVVDAVAGHRDDVARAPGARARCAASVPARPVPARRPTDRRGAAASSTSSVGKVGSQHDASRRRARRCGDRRRGRGMVARDHHDADAGLPATSDGLRHLGTNRVGQSDESDERKIRSRRLRRLRDIDLRPCGSRTPRPAGLRRGERVDLGRDPGALLVRAAPNLLDRGSTSRPRRRPRKSPS